MNFQEILQDFPRGKMRDLLAEAIIKQPEDLLKLWGFAQSTERYAWRGCWLIDKINERNPEVVAPLIPAMVELIPRVKNDGQKRIFLKMVCQHELGGNLNGELLDCCINWLQDPNVPIAVRCGAMDAVVLYARVYPEIKSEVSLILKDQLIDATPAIRSRGRKTLRLLEKI